MIDAVETAIASHEWTVDSGARVVREHVHAAVQELRALGAATWQRAEGLLANDLVTAMEQATGVGAGTALEAARGVESMGRHLGDGAMTNVLRRLPEFDPSVELDEASAEISARCALTLVARQRELEWKKPPFGVAAKRVLLVVPGVDGDSAVAYWLQLAPKAPEIAPVAVASLPDLKTKTKGGLSEWAADSKRTQRTALAEHMMRSHKDASAWLRVLAQEPLNEARLAELVRDRVLDGPSVVARALAAREAQVLNLETRAAGQTLSGAVSALLQKDGRAKGDIGVAALLASAVPKDRVKETWGKTFKKRCDEKDYRFSEEEAKSLQAARVSIPKDSVAKWLRKKLGL